MAGGTADLAGSDIPVLRSVLWHARALQEQSLYSGKARSSAGGMEKGLTLTKVYYY
jgi:hypothetical protein